MKISKIVSALAPVALTLCLASGWSTVAHSALSSTTGAKLVVTPEYKEGELLVKFKQRAYRTSSLAVEKSAPEVDSFESIHEPSGNSTFSSEEPWQIARLKSGSDTLRLKEQLARHPDVESVELNYRVTVAQIPNDPRFSEQWGLHNIGQTGGAFDADIDAPEAWDVTTGSNVVVAVIDTGVDYTHEDLRANMWINTGEIPANGIDDDGNGYVDDVHGYDFLNNDNNPADDNGHGTHVAGVIAAAGNNGVGITGVNWGSAKIMPVKFLGADGSGNIVNAIRALRYATAMGAKVTNNSWTGGGYSQALLDAIMEADAEGALFVAAAGNDGLNTDFAQVLPAGYDAPNVIAVTATDQYDNKPAWANYGATTVDLAAPGMDILSTVPRGVCGECTTGYSYMRGTSMAAPFVAGVAALVLGQNTLSPADLKKRLMATADKLPSLGGRTASGGRLNADHAVRNIIDEHRGLPDLALSNLTAPLSVKAGEYINLSSRLENLGGQESYSLTLFALSTDSTITWADYWIGCHYFRSLAPGSFANITPVFYIPADLAPGTYFIGGMVDFINLVEERNESNNASIIQIEVLAP